jgi:sterol desaturase/sphingolipid hydroxylase (fatty acid hydroxylase superfamily)
MLFVSIVHAAVIFGQVLVGVFHSGAPFLWLTAYLTLAAGLSLSVLLLSSLADAAFRAAGRHLQPFASRSLVVAEALESCRAMAVFAGFAAWPRMLLLQGRPTALVWSLAAAQPNAPHNLALYCVKLVAITCLTDFYMYFKHRMLHAPRLFCFHKQHHAFHNPTPFASFAVAPVEAALTFAPVLFLCLPSAPVWAHAYAAWTAGFVALNLYLHSGVYVSFLETALPSLGLNSSAFHNVHHQSGGTRNFGELLFIWDYFLGSGAHPAEAIEDGTVAKRI